MKKILMCLLMLSLFCGCASSKKNKQKFSKEEISTTVSKKTEETTKEKVDNFIIDKTTDKDVLEVIQEETVISKKVIDSAGVQITVPETKIKRTILKRTKEKEISKLDTTKKETDIFIINKQDSVAINKSEETENKTKENKSGFFGVIIKIIIFVGIVLLIGRFIIKKTTIL